MNNKKPLYIVISLVVGFAIGTGLTCSYGAMKSFRTDADHAKYLQKHQNKITLKQLDKRVTKIEKILEIKLERKK